PPGAEGPIRLEHDVAGLAGEAVGPRIDLTAEQDAGADAGGYRDVDQLAGPTRGATSMLAQRGQVCVVVEEAGNAGCPRQDPVERDVPEAGQVARADDKTRRRVDRTRKSDAERPHATRCGAVLPQGILHRRHDALDHVLPPSRSFGGTPDDGRQAA